MKKEQTTRKLPTQLTGQGQVLLQQAGPGHNIHSETVALRILGFVPGLESVDVNRYDSLGELQLHAAGTWKVHLLYQQPLISLPWGLPPIPN